MSKFIQRLKNFLRPSKIEDTDLEADIKNTNHSFSLLTSFFVELKKHMLKGDWRGKTQFNFEDATNDLQNFYKNDLIRVSKYKSIKKSSRQVKCLKNLASAIGNIKLSDFDWLTSGKFEIKNCKKFIEKMDKIIIKLNDFKNLKSDDLLKSQIDNEANLSSIISPIEEIKKFANSCISKAKIISK